MAIGLLTDNKLLSLALQGYNPFQPDKGIFCGGYQGILYPNPTTLVAAGFDPYEFIDYMPTIYTPGGNHDGLGKGNPGIDYKNPGHILGLLDTFGRMSYGLRMLLDIHAGSNPISFDPIVNIDMPLSLANGSIVTVGLSDIYPVFTEIPSDWFKTFNVDPTGVITPATHTPSTNTIELQNLTDLFNNKALSSYLDIIQYFRDIIQQLATSSSTLNNKVSMDFTLVDPTSPWDDQDHDTFENYLGRPYDHPLTTIRETQSFEAKGTSYFQSNTAQPLEALNILTGSTLYHDGPNNMGDYRSITELNSVINTVPLQMVGGTYFKEFINEYDDLEKGRIISVASYMLVDFVVNISNASLELQTITLEGNAISKNLIEDPTNYWFESTTVDVAFDAEEEEDIVRFIGPFIVNAREVVAKQIKISTSITNEFSWDKSWLDTSDLKTEETFEDSSSEISQILNSPFTLEINPIVPIVADQTPLGVDFNKTFVLSPGCNSIRMTARLDSSHSLLMLMRMKPEFWFENAIISGPDIELLSPVESHTSLGNPDNVKNFTSPALQLSFSITGTNMNSKTYSVEV